MTAPTSFSLRTGLRLLCAVLAWSAMSLQAAQTVSVDNGSFELPSVPFGGFQSLVPGSTDLVGWTILGEDVAVVSGGFSQGGITFQAQDGNQWLDLSGVSSNSKSNGVSQSIATTAGQTYQLSFQVGSASDGLDFFPSTVDLSIDGGARSSYSNPTAPSDALNWRRFTTTFVALSGTTAITFYNGGELGNFNTSLDNVTVSAVPETPSLVLLGAGLLAMSCLGPLRSRRPAGTVGV